jgi:hypothetical protein
MLVATNSMPSSTTAKRIVAIIAPSKTVKVVSRQQGVSLLQQFIDAEVARATPRYTTPIPKTVQRKAGVIVIAAVILKKAAIIPTAMLMITAMVVQVFLQEQSQFDIYITSLVSICLYLELGAKAKDCNIIKHLPRF